VGRSKRTCANRVAFEVCARSERLPQNDRRSRWLEGNTRVATEEIFSEREVALSPVMR